MSARPLMPRSSDTIEDCVDGRLVVLACPAALCPHAEFALAEVLGMPVSLTWAPQPTPVGRTAATQLQASVDLVMEPGTAGRLATTLRRLGAVHFEVWEGASRGCDAVRYQHTPELGLHQAVLGSNGDVAVGEGRLRALLAETAPGPVGALQLARAIEDLLGDAWDEQLEPLRAGGDGAAVTWLRQVG